MTSTLRMLRVRDQLLLARDFSSRRKLYVCSARVTNIRLIICVRDSLDQSLETEVPFTRRQNYSLPSCAITCPSAASSSASVGGAPSS